MEWVIDGVESEGVGELVFNAETRRRRARRGE